MYDPKQKDPDPNRTDEHELDTQPEHEPPDTQPEAAPFEDGSVIVLEDDGYYD